MLGLVVAFLLGVVTTAVVGALAVLRWLYVQSTPAHYDVRRGFEQFISPQLPQRLCEVYGQVNSEDGTTEVKVESCNWFNLIVDFVFRELRDSEELQSLVLKKINKEFEELMLTKTEGRMIEQLTAREYCLGTSLPVITSATVVRIDCAEDCDTEPQEIDICLEVDYSGGFRLAIDADLVFNKSAYVAIQVLKIKGHGRLRFTREPFTHWSFAFNEDPELELKVESQFEGRDFPQLSSFIENQLRKWVRRKHTLPGAKKRFKPFFLKPKPQNQLLDVYVHDCRVTEGRLLVEVRECSRLVPMDGAVSTYCTVGIASSPWKPLVSLWRTQWPLMEFEVRRRHSENIGIRYRMIIQEDLDERYELLLIHQVLPQSSAFLAGIKTGDVLKRVNNVKVNTVRQVTKLIKKSKEKSVLLTVQRPPSHCLSQLQSFSTIPPTAATPLLPSHQPSSQADASSSDHRNLQASTTDECEHVDTGVPVGEGVSTALHGEQRTHDEEAARPQAGQSSTAHRRSDSDTISLCGVLGEVGLEGEGLAGASSSQLPPSQVRRRGHSVLAPRSSSYRPEQYRRRPQRSPGVDALDGDSISLNEGLISGSYSSASPPPLTSLPPQPPPSTDHSRETSVERGGVRVGGQMRNRTNSATPAQAQTKHIRASGHPVWNESFSFAVGTEHRYLNVCVWNKLAEGKGDLLIGHVTLPLMDVAMNCLCTNSATYHQRYVLTVAQPAKAAASRTAMQATTSSATRHSSAATAGKKNRFSKDIAFAGDILLRFQHFPSPSGAHEKSGIDEQEVVGTENTENEPSQRRFAEHHPFTGVEGHMPSDHRFRVEEVEGPQRCDICQRKIWGLTTVKVYKCQSCKLKCHKKCAHYCQSSVPCYRRQLNEGGIDLDRLNRSLERDSTVYSDEEHTEPRASASGGEGQSRGRQATGGDSSTVGEGASVLAWRGSHRDLQQTRKHSRKAKHHRHHHHSDRRSSSFEILEVPSPERDREEGPPAEDEPDAGRLTLTATAVAAPAADQPDDESDSNISEECYTPVSTSDSEPVVEKKQKENIDSELSLEQFSYSLYIELPLEERRRTLEQKLAGLQLEIERLNELISGAESDLPRESASLQDRLMKGELVGDYEKKLEPLKLLHLQHLLALEHCNATASDRH